MYRADAPARVYFHGWIRPDLGVPQLLTETLSRLAGRDVEVRLIDRATRFRRLLVPSTTFAISEAGSPQCFAWAQAFARRIEPEPGPDAPQRIYFTRRGLKRRKRKLEGEEVLEDLFARHGFAVLRPETLSFTEQVGLMRNCRALAGCEGSALHQAMFMAPGQSVVGLDVRYNRNQGGVEAMAGHRALHFRCLRQAHRGRRGDEDRLALDTAYLPSVSLARCWPPMTRAERRPGSHTDAVAAQVPDGLARFRRAWSAN